MLHEITPSDRYLAECENDRVVQARSTLNRLRNSFARFWSDPVVNAQLLGTQAVAAFTIHAKSAEYVVAIAPELAGEIPAIDTARWALAWHENGSLTVTEIVPEPPAEEDPVAEE